MIRLTRKRLIVTAVVFFLLTGTLVITWEVCDWPPVRLILKYGFPPAGGASGRVHVVNGIGLVELSPGYARVKKEILWEEGDILGRVFGALGLPLGSKPRRHDKYYVDRWVEACGPTWISTAPVPKLDSQELWTSLREGNIEAAERFISTHNSAQLRFADPDIVYYALYHRAIKPTPSGHEFAVSQRSPKEFVPILSGSKYDRVVGVRAAQMLMSAFYVPRQKPGLHHEAERCRVIWEPTSD